MLSGTIREPHKSLESLDILRGSLTGEKRDVVVFAHAWTNVADTQNQSWSKLPSLEPTPELIEQYGCCRYDSHDWMELRPQFVHLHQKWEREYNLTNITTYGALGQFWSLGHAFSLIQFCEFGLFDWIVRLRYDCLLRHDPIPLCNEGFGLYVPLHGDFGGLNDQMALFKCDTAEPGDDHKSWHFASSYFRAWDRLDNIMSRSFDFHPEKWMEVSVKDGQCPLFRPPILYTIH